VAAVGDAHEPSAVLSTQFRRLCAAQICALFSTMATWVHGWPCGRDLAYLVGIERTTASVEASPRSYSLRSTTIFRRENGEWKAVHRHADPAGDSGSAREQIIHFGEESSQS
jgi:hypothetical protein